MGKVVASHAAVARSIAAEAACIDLYYALGAQGVLSMRYSPTSKLDQLSLTPLSAAGCGRLQLGAPH